MKFAVVFAILAALAAPSSLGAQTEGATVQAVLPACEAVTTGKLDGDALFCLGMVMGVADIMNTSCGCIRQGIGNDPRLAANVGGVSVQATAQAFVNWSRDNPQFWDIPASTGMALALNRLFPC